ncbi:MAG: S41 family peptidase [Planctomycetota bacterium]
MSRASVAVVALLVLMVVGVSGTAWGQVSPFTRVEFEDDGRVMVTLDGERVQLVSIAGLPVDELVSVSKHEFGTGWKKRIGEDLLEVLGAAEVGLDRANAIDLEVRDADEVRLIEDAPMTANNRRQVWQFNSERLEADREATISPASLDALADVIHERHAYATLRNIDLDRAVAVERHRLGEFASKSEVRLAAQRIVSQLGDGHASVEDWTEARNAVPGRLPFLLASAEGGVAAFASRSGGLLDERHPFAVSIDGRPLDDWIAAVAPYVPAGSPQLVRERSLRLLRYFGFARAQTGMVPAPQVTIRLRSSDGDSETEMTMELVDRRTLYGVWPRTVSGQLGARIAMLRLPSMQPPSGRPSDDVWQRELRDELVRLTRNASGLIIDVRGNGGGRRLPILAIMPMLMEVGGEPVVVNAAQARLWPGQPHARPGGYLDNRFLWPESWEGWTGAERAAIERFKAGFEPQWTAPAGTMSEWHYMVVSPGDAELPRFDGPVVVLMDEVCFSATDIFLAALGELPHVTLVGTPSAGGSAKSRDHEAMGLEVTLASMASYQPSGQMYDGNGVQPDIVVQKKPGDHVHGGGDAQLDAAIDLLSSQIHERR